MIKKIYDTFILKYPFIILTILMLFVSTLGFFATKVEIDASAETLLLEDDKDLKFFREVNKTYDNSSFFVVTFSSKDDLLSNESLLDELNIQDKSSWTKKEINTLNDISKKFPAIKSIFSDLYNKSSSDSKADKRFLLLKELNTYHEFLKG